MQTYAFKKLRMHTNKAHRQKKAGAKLFSHDSKRRDDESLYSNYTFTTLIDRFTSLRTTMHNFMVVKEPTYKI